MSLIRAVAHNTAVQIGGKAVSTLLGLVAVAIMTRSLGLEQFGWYITATGFLQFVGILSDFGFTVTTSNLLSEPAFAKPKVLATAFSWRLLTALIFQGLAPIIIIFFPYPGEVKIAVAITTLSFFALALIQVFTGYLREELQTGRIMAAEILGRILLVAGVSVVALRGWGFLPMMAAITLASVVSALYLWKRIGRIPWSLDPDVSRALWQKMWPTALAVVFNAIYLQGDRVILPLFAPQTEVGLYGASYRVIDILIQVAAIIMGTVLPLITAAWSRGLTQEFKRRAALSAELLVLVLLPMIAGIVILATPILTLVAGPEFRAGGPLLVGLTISVLGVLPGMIFGHLALAINRQKEVLWIYASDALLSLIAYFIFIQRYGAWGAVGVTIGSELYAGVLLMAATWSFARYRLRWAALAKITLASALMALGVYFLQPLSLLLSIALGIVFYGVGLLLFRVTSWAALKELARPNPVA